MHSNRVRRALRPEPIVDERELHTVRERQGYRAALAGWLACSKWSHFITLTIAHSIPAPRYWEPERMWRRVMSYIRGVGWRAGKGVPFFAALEYHADGKTLHAHILIDGAAHLSNAEVQAPWRDGLAHVEAFDPARGDVAAYITKGLLDADNHDMWRCSRRVFHPAPVAADTQSSPRGRRARQSPGGTR